MMSVFHTSPLYHPQHAKIHWSKRAYSNVDRHNNNADTEFIVQHQQQHYNIDNHIREKYDQVFWEDTRLLFKIMESIKTQLREVQNKYGTFQRLQRTFVQAIQRSYAQAFNHSGMYHITNISHIENLLKDFTEHATVLEKE